MLRAKFHELWNWYVVKYLESPASGSLHTAYSARKLCLPEDAEAAVLDQYEHIKEIFKKTYFDKEYPTVDRHKRAAILTYAFLQVSPLKCAKSYLYHKTDVFLLLPNEVISFYLGLHSLTIDYKPDAITRVINECKSVFFTFPEVHNTSMQGGSNGANMDTYQMSVVI